MAKRTEGSRGDFRYFVRFVVTALLLVTGTLVLVLVVLPQRYVLSAGFVESGQNFPNPGTPFTPLQPIRVAALPLPEPPPDVEILPGPAQVLWEEVGPLLAAGQYDAAVPIFEAYLSEFPEDSDVRRELAATLLAAERDAEAVPVMRELSGQGAGPEIRLALARTLRDLGRLDEASELYAQLLEASPNDEALALEWAQAWAWVERYPEAEDALARALELNPESASLKIELARLYYYTDRLLEAEAILGGMDEETLALHDGLALRNDVRAALFVPPVEEIEAEPPTLLEQAVAAREADDFDAARRLFGVALDESPNDPEIWLAYANFLEYELANFEGARQALREVERLGATDAQLQYRLALLEAWTDEPDAAMSRLRALLLELPEETPEPGADGARPVSRADAHALMGDLHRWNGDRVPAAHEYDRATAYDPENQRALDGREAVELEVALLIDEVENPRIGTFGSALGDTDDFGRFDLGGEWVGVRSDWVWSGRVGQRWMRGNDPTAAPGTLDGLFVEIAPARWWRLATVRTELRLGTQWVRGSDMDLTFGAGLQYRPVRGGRYALEYTHEPAYGLAATLQSAIASVTLDRVVATVERPLNERWDLSVQADAASLRSEGATPDASTRLQGSVAVSRRLNRFWGLGWAAMGLTYSEPAPAPSGLRYFWDPSIAVATGPVIRAEGPIGARWEGRLRANPGIAFIDERTPEGLQTVPQLSVDGGMTYDRPGLRASFDLFYGQARLEGYRTYGARISLSTTSWLSTGPRR